MNSKDKERIRRVSEILTSIPFSASGHATQTGVGAISFEQDMRAVRIYIAKVFEGMLCEGIEGLEEGWDYHNPDKLLDALEKWIDMRIKEQWLNADEYSFRHIWDKEKRERE